MKPTSFRSKVSKILTVVIVLTAVGVSGQTNDSTIPIKFENVPVPTAIETLTRLVGVNYLFDPKALVKLHSSDFPEPTITTNWTDMTPKQVLGTLLKDHGLYLVEDPVTSIAEISMTNRIINPVDIKLLGSDTNGAVPMTLMDVPLDMALNHLVQSAHLDVTLDPKLSDALDTTTHQVVRLPTVSVHWENVSARQAIVALCENYNLTFVKDPATGGLQIKRKE